MVARKSGCVLFTASMTAFIGMPSVVAYSAAKSAYVGIVRALATEWGPHGVRVNGIAPGWIASEMLDRALAGDPARKARILARTPLARFGEPDDIGWAAVYLASPAARFVSGVVLPIDGGAVDSFRAPAPDQCDLIPGGVPRGQPPAWRVSRALQSPASDQVERCHPDGESFAAPPLAAPKPPAP
jgi:hypothetical protein